MTNAKITQQNFEKTLVDTLAVEENRNNRNKVYFLDKHSLDGKEYYTVTHYETLLKCFDNLEEAREFFNSKISAL